jgi:hypothetical protein
MSLDLVTPFDDLDPDEDDLYDQGDDYPYYEPDDWDGMDWSDLFDEFDVDNDGDE